MGGRGAPATAAAADRRRAERAPALAAGHSPRRAGARHPKKSHGLLRPPERVMFGFIQAEKADYPVRTLCAVLGVSPSGYYAWRGRPLVTPRVRANQGLRARIRAIHAASRGRYGSPR